MAEKSFSFDDLNKEMAKNSILGERLDLSDISLVDHYIDSGNYMLNACLTGSLFRGFPNNRAVALAGPSGTGKTYLLLNAIKHAQELGYYIIFYDSENAVDRDLVEKFGIDPKKFRYEPVGTVQEFRSSIVNLTEILIKQKKEGKEIPKIFIALDSAGALPTQKEIDDAMEKSEKADMTRAKIYKSIFRILIYRLALIKAPFVFTNHTYETQSFISQETQGGGRGPEYAASIILFLGKAQLKEDDKKVGIIVTVKPNKNRFSIPNTIKIHIRFERGMNRYIGLETSLLLENSSSSWANTGIGVGTLIDENAFNKQIVGKIEKEKDEKKKKHLESLKEKIELAKYDGTEYGLEKMNRYFLTTEEAKSFGIGAAKKIIIKHLGKEIEENLFFTKQVFTMDILKMIDENVIKPRFEYGNIDDDDTTELIENLYSEKILDEKIKELDDIGSEQVEG